MHFVALVEAEAPSYSDPILRVKEQCLMSSCFYRIIGGVERLRPATGREVPEWGRAWYLEVLSSPPDLDFALGGPLGMNSA